ARSARAGPARLACNLPQAPRMRTSMPRTKTCFALSLLLWPGAVRAAPSIEDLQKQVELLTRTVDGLQKQLDQRSTGAAEASETATRQDVMGVQADLENFKYQVQRDRETATALSTRGLA